ncbi:MAG TPA: hypothetical protein DEA55_11120 [Rhodospirillaceae bacterium]|nr:hypothetical protein [Rhodospirillaceae bacterium]
MKKFVWDTSALINIKEPNAEGYSPGHSFMKDFSDGWIEGPYLNIFPSIAVFELSATVSRKHREGQKILRDFYIMTDNSKIYDVDRSLIDKSHDLAATDGFNKLRGADLIFACIAYLEDAFLITLDRHYQAVANKIKVIDLRDSIDSPRYRRLFE